MCICSDLNHHIQQYLIYEQLSLHAAAIVLTWFNNFQFWRNCFISLLAKSATVMPPYTHILPRNPGMIRTNMHMDTKRWKQHKKKTHTAITFGINYIINVCIAHSILSIHVSPLLQEEVAGGFLTLRDSPMKGGTSELQLQGDIWPREWAW